MVPGGMHDQRRPARGHLAQAVGLTSRRRAAVRRWLTIGAFLAPALVALIVLRLWPLVSVVITSLQFTPLDGGPPHFAGLRAFRLLLEDPGFWSALQATALFNILVNPFQVVLALALAILLSQRLPAVGLWRTLVFLPVAVPEAVSSVIWGVAYRQDGPINGFLALLHVPGQRFLTSPTQALPSIIVLVSWVGVGYWMVFLVAGLQDIPRDYYEAAALDGAGAWARFLHITLPLLRRPLVFVLVSDTVANALDFAPVQILTQGGPNNTTDFLMYDIFNRAYQSGDINGASAETVVLIVLLIAVIGAQFRLLRPQE